MRKFILISTFLITFVKYVKMDTFNSMAKMKNLAQLEVGMIKILRRFIKDSDTLELKVEDNVREFEATVSREIDYISNAHYAENPINAFHLLKRVNENWDRVLATIICDTCDLTDPAHEFQINLQNAEMKTRSSASISTTEVELAAMAIVRLWQTYKLDLETLFRGQILNAVTNPLSCEDVLYICSSLDNMNEYYKEIVWLQELLEDVHVGNRYCSTMEISRTERSLAAAYAKYGMPWMSLEILENSLNNDFGDVKKDKDAEYYKLKLRDISEADKRVKLQPREEELWRPKYEALCRGEGIRSVKEMSSLRCLYRQTKLPYYVAKEEILSYSPRISIFHEVITAEETETVKADALDLLTTSTVQGTNEFQVMHTYRVSQTAWMPATYSQLVQRLSLRVQLITSLSTLEAEQSTHAEYLQIGNKVGVVRYEDAQVLIARESTIVNDGDYLVIACGMRWGETPRIRIKVLNYGIGGMYQVHHDFLLGAHQAPYCMDAGKRVATWMFYLSDVDAGGATVFPDVNITIPVEKGAAAFWYNLQPNGEYDYRTLHAGCPVLLGSKWVANKWIREYGQIFKRKCGKTYDSIDPIFPQ